MAFSFSSLLSLGLIALFLVLIQQCCFAQTTFSLQNDQETECRLEKLSALEPSKRVESEGGVTEYWDDKNEQLHCVGVSLVRYTIRPKGLLLPFYANAPRIHYVLQGRGIQETVVSGCPAMYRSQLKSFTDEHQRLQTIQQDDVVAVPSSSTQWIYNTGDSDLVFFSLIYTANEANQLNLTPRNFFLAGNPLAKQLQTNGNQSKSWSWYNHYEGQHESFGSNIFSGMAMETVVASLNVDFELAEKVQGVEDERGPIILLEEGIEWLSPEHDAEEAQRRKRDYGKENGLEETVCSLAFVHPLGEPRMHADKYNPRGGHLTGLNTPNMPVLEFLRLGVDRGVLYKGAILVPHYNMNCHAVIYCTRGSGWIQVVRDGGQRVFDGVVQEGQVLIVPQHYVVVKKGGDDEFDWVAIKTNDNPMIIPLAGELSLLQAFPVSMLMNLYRMKKEEAMDLKRRDELTFVSPLLGSHSKSFME